MKRVKNSKSQKAEKREAVFGVAADVFAQYGVRRTAMNDIAQAAGISRPALYLMVENKEDDGWETDSQEEETPKSQSKP